MRHLNGFAALAARYEGFIVDLWGVIHDGVTPYDGALDCLARLRGLNRPTVLLSNAPRRAHVAAAGMRAMGIDETLYTAVVTSGEVTHTMLRDRPDSFFAGLGDRVWHLGPERDRSVIEGIPLRRVEVPDDADFVLNTGPDDERSPTEVAPYETELQACYARGLPMVCANPDLEIIRGGARLICAGALAQRYEAIGGVARWIGKPDPAVYEPVLDLLGVRREQVLAVGDALRTDIAGAKAVGLDSCWVLGGIHAEALRDDPASAEAAARDVDLSPVAAISSFTW